MNESRYQFSTKELLLLPLVAIAAPSVNSALNYLLYDLERACINTWYNSIASTNLISRLPTDVLFLFESFAHRGVDTAVAILIAITLVSLGRLTQPASLLLLVTLPFSPQIGRDPLDINVHSLVERWPEFVANLVGILVVLRIATRTKSCCNSRAQLLALSVFFVVAALGWWNMNPRGFSAPPLRGASKTDNKASVYKPIFSGQQPLSHSSPLAFTTAMLFNYHRQIQV